MKGRKRHLLVDTQGLVLKAVVHPANIQDRDGGKLVLSSLPATFPRLRHLWVDSGYQGKFIGWVNETRPWSVEVVKHWWTGVQRVWVGPGQEPPTIPRGFHVLPKRWIIERTFSWLGKQRRLAKDYEALPETSETLIYATMIGVMAKRLAH